MPKHFGYEEDGCGITLYSPDGEDTYRAHPEAVEHGGPGPGGDGIDPGIRGDSRPKQHKITPLPEEEDA